MAVRTDFSMAPDGRGEWGVLDPFKRKRTHPVACHSKDGHREISKGADGRMLLRWVPDRADAEGWRKGRRHPEPAVTGAVFTNPLSL